MIERVLYGMQTSDGKIITKYSGGVNQLLQPKSRDSLKALKVTDNGLVKWFKTEQTIAYPKIKEVAVKDPSQGGRTWVQSQIFLMSLNEFIACTKSGKNPFEIFEASVLPELDKFPDIDPIPV